MAQLVASDLRNRWKGYPDTKAAVLYALSQGWVMRTSGKGKPRLFCPCDASDAALPGGRKPSFAVNWTPQNDGTHAARIKNNLRKCPDQHGLLK